MSLSDIGRIVLRRWLIVMVVILACAGAAVAYVWSVPTTYTASTRLYVSMATGTSVNDSYQGGLASQQRVTSYSHVAGGVTVAERVIADLGLPTTPEELQSRISVTFPPASALLDIAVTDSSPEGARLLADKVAAQFRQLVGEIETTTIGAAPAAEATVIDPARLPAGPNGPAVLRLLAIGLLGGIALGCTAAFVRDRLDPRLRRPEQLGGGVPAAPVLASLPGNPADARWVFRRLRARLMPGADARDLGSMLFTSASRHSVPMVATGLAGALAATGREVVLVDADLSGKGASALLDMPSAPGLADRLRTGSPVEDFLRTSSEGYAVLPLGTVDERTPDLLDSPRMPELLSQLQARFDHVLVDTAPVGADTVAVTLAPRSAATVVIAELQTSSLFEVRAAEESLRDAGATLLGVIVAARPPRRQRRQERRRDRSSPVTRPSLVPAHSPR